MHKEAKTTNTQPPTATLKGYQPCCRAGEESWSKERRVGARAWRSKGKGVEEQWQGRARASAWRRKGVERRTMSDQEGGGRAREGRRNGSAKMSALNPKMLKYPSVTNPNVPSTPRPIAPRGRT